MMTMTMCVFVGLYPVRASEWGGETVVHRTNIPPVRTVRVFIYIYYTLLISCVFNTHIYTLYRNELCTHTHTHKWLNEKPTEKFHSPPSSTYNIWCGNTCVYVFIIIRDIRACVCVYVYIYRERERTKNKYSFDIRIHTSIFFGWGGYWVIYSLSYFYKF